MTNFHSPPVKVDFTFSLQRILQGSGKIWILPIDKCFSRVYTHFKDRGAVCISTRMTIPREGPRKGLSAEAAGHRSPVKPVRLKISLGLSQQCGELSEQ